MAFFIVARAFLFFFILTEHWESKKESELEEGDIITKDIICVYWSANKARGTTMLLLLQVKYRVPQCFFVVAEMKTTTVQCSNQTASKRSHRGLNYYYHNTVNTFVLKKGELISIALM